VFELLFAGDGTAHVLKVFEIYEAVDDVITGVGAGELFAVGGCSSDEAVGHADVEIARAAGEDVDPEVIFARHGGMVTEDVGSRFPAGMTARKARTNATADSLRE